MKSKKKKSPVKAIVIIIIIVIVILALLYACKGDWQFGGIGSGQGIIPAANNAGTEGTDVGGTPPVQVIGISEDKIIYDDKEITVEELEALLLKNQGTEGIWELHDTYHADKSTYDEVKQLLKKMDIAFIEK